MSKQHKMSRIPGGGLSLESLLAGGVAMSGGRLALVVLALCVAAAPAPSRADMSITANVALTEDADWREQGTVTIADGVTLDLNGHVLRVAALAGAGSVIDSQNFEILDYVEANGAQRIVTDLVPNANTSVEVVATPTVNSPYTLFGTKTWNNYRFLCMGENSNWYFFGKAVVVATFTPNTRYRFVVSRGNAALVNDETGVEVGAKGVQMDNTDNAALTICGITGGTQRGKFKMHSFKVWHENAMRFDFVPARNPATGEVGLLNRLDGTLHVSDESAFLPGTAAGSLGVGALRVEAASEAALAGFTGTVAPTVRFALDGTCALAADADWRRFDTLAIDGTVDLAGHDLTLSNLRGVGAVTRGVVRQKSLVFLKVVRVVLGQKLGHDFLVFLFLQAACGVDNSFGIERGHALQNGELRGMQSREALFAEAPAGVGASTQNARVGAGNVSQDGVGPSAVGEERGKRRRICGVADRD